MLRLTTLPRSAKNNANAQLSCRECAPLEKTMTALGLSADAARGAASLRDQARATIADGPKVTLIAWPVVGLKLLRSRVHGLPELTLDTKG